jgi:hypothetical protein
VQILAVPLLRRAKLILEHNGETLPVVIFNGEELVFHTFLADKGYEPEWTSEYIISINNTEPFDSFGEFLTEWRLYRGNLSSI